MSDPNMRTLRMRIDEQRLIRELPNFFQSLEDAVAELVQNRYRAGASEMTIRINWDDRTLVVEDNGRGAATPEPMITAGGTGWDESVVVEPAGLGLFALLGLSEWVEITSRAEGHRGWRLFVSEEAFTGGDAHAYWMPYDDGPHPAGTIIQAWLSDRVVAHKRYGEHDWVKQLRHYFPVEITLCETLEGKVVETKLPPPTIQGARIQTPAGDFVRHASTPYWSGGDVGVIWEYRLLDRTSTWRDLHGALTQIPDGKWVAEMLGRQRYVWFVDAKTGVRPKLPDRKELVTDQRYRQAIRTLAQALVEAADIPGLRHQIAMRSWPETIDDRYGYEMDRATADIPIHPLFDLRQKDVLLLAGYHECRFPKLAYPSFHQNDNDRAFDFDDRHIWARNVLQVEDGELAESLCREEIWAVQRGNAPITRVRVVNARIANLETNCSFGICDRIEIIQNDEVVATAQHLSLLEGTRDLVQGLRIEKPEDDEEEGDYTPPLYLIVHGDPESALRQLCEDQNFMGFVLWRLWERNDLDDYIEDWEDGTYNEAHLEEAITTAFVETFFPSTLEAQIRYERLRRLESELGDLRLKADGLRREMTDALNQHPEIDTLPTVIEAISRLTETRVEADRWRPQLSHSGE